MTSEQARECADILANAYGMGSRRVAWYANMLERFTAGPCADVLTSWVEREKVPPTISAIKAGIAQRLETLGVQSPTFARRSDRMEQLVIWRSLVEEDDTTENWTRDRIDAYDRIRWMDPPVTPAEWREARVIADNRHAERNAQLVSEGKKPRPPRPSASWFEAPSPPDPQPILSREAHAAGFAALRIGMERRYDKPQMVRFVLTAVREAEAKARAAEKAAAVDEMTL